MRFFPIAPGEERFAALQSAAIRLLGGYESALGCKLVVHDRAGLLPWDGNLPLLPPEYRRHYHPLCVHRRLACPSWDRQCKEHCLDAVNEHGRLGEPFVHRCWKGGSELVVPIMLKDRHVLTIFAGVFRGVAPTDPTAVRDVKLTVIRDSLPKLRIKSLPEQVRLLRLLGNCLMQLVPPEPGVHSKRLGKIQTFLRDRSSSHVTLEDLARELGLSPGQCSRVVSELLGKPFQEALREVRLQRGAVLLRSHDYSVGEVARLVGFESEYHFNRKFKVMFGLPPGIWRRGSNHHT